MLLLWIMTIADYSANISATSKGFDEKAEHGILWMVGFSFPLGVCTLRVVWVGSLPGGGGGNSY
jgi:hypothetical protein